MIKFGIIHSDIDSSYLRLTYLYLLFMNILTNPCIECGKERIDGKSWIQTLGNSKIIHTLTICPDPECQKIVDKAIAARRLKAENLSKAKIAAKRISS